MRRFESISERRHQGCLALLVLLVSLGMSTTLAADGEKTPILRAMPAETVQRTLPRSSSSGVTLAFLGLLLAGAIVARRVIQRRREGRVEGLPKGSIEMLSRQQLDDELTVRVLRVGSRVLVVGSSPQGLSTLSEISDPGEFATITGKAEALAIEPQTASPFDGRATIRPIVPASRHRGPPSVSAVLPAPRSPEPDSVRRVSSG